MYIMKGYKSVTRLILCTGTKTMFALKKKIKKHKNYVFLFITQQNGNAYPASIVTKVSNMIWQKFVVKPLQLRSITQYY